MCFAQQSWLAGNKMFYANGHELYTMSVIIVITG